MSTVAVLPIKRYRDAKQRLADVLGGESRRTLVAAMARDVLAALRVSAALDAIVVVTSEPAAAHDARAAGAVVVSDSDASSHSAAALIGVAAAVAHGASRVLLVPGDCPLLDTNELAVLLQTPVSAPPAPNASAAPATDAHPPARVVVVPDRDGAGTNALLLDPPDAIAPSFGPGSRQRHLDLAHAAGAAANVATLDSLALDIDTEADLDALRAILASGVGPARHTATALASLGPVGAALT